MFLSPLILLGLFFPVSAWGRKNSNAIAAGWYGGWHASDFPLNKIPWNKYTHLIYSFAETGANGTLTLTDLDKQQLPPFVAAARKHGVKALVAIGGWSGSTYFSSAVATPANRTAFVKEIVDFAVKYKLDGIDFDWEYPAGEGIGCNIFSPNDTANLLSLLKELQSNPVGSKLILSAATGLTPYPDENGDPFDASGFAKVLDYIAIMNYDVWGPWTATVGPNAPLNDTCAPSDDQKGGSAVSAVDAWVSAGMPRHQIVLGVPGYGHSYRVAKADAIVNSTTKLALYPAFNATDIPAGDAWDDLAGTDQCGNPTLNGGNIDLWGLIDQNYLTKQGKPQKGIAYVYDECSQTPFVYNATSGILVAYDDARSFSAKSRFIRDSRLRGFSIWEAGSDYGNILIDAIRCEIF